MGKTKQNKINLSVKELKELKKVLIGKRIRRKANQKRSTNDIKYTGDGLSSAEKSYTYTPNPITERNLGNTLLYRQLLNQPFLSFGEKQVVNQPFENKYPMIKELEDRISGITNEGSSIFSHLNNRLKRLEFSSMENKEPSIEEITREEEEEENPIGIDYSNLTEENEELTKPALNRERTASFDYEGSIDDNFNNDNPLLENTYTTPKNKKRLEIRNKLKSQYNQLVNELKELGYEENEYEINNVQATTRKATIENAIKRLKKIKTEKEKLRNRPNITTFFKYNFV